MGYLNSMVNATTFHLVGSILLFLSTVLLLPFGASIYFYSLSAFSSSSVLVSFLITIISSLLIGLLLRHFFKADLSSLGARQGFAVVTLSWVFVTFFGSLPFYISGICSNFVDAYFETMSGFTTTGASIFKTIESIPPSLLLWRCMTQWLGGMGIIILTVAILPEMRICGYHLFRAEIPGGSTFEKIKPRMSETAKTFWKIYVAFSLCEFILLYIGGMGSFDAICHTFTTMSTGGFSTQTASVAAFHNPFIEFIIFSFMIIAGTNFGLHYLILKGHLRSAFQNPEFRLYLNILGCAMLFTFIALLISNQGNNVFLSFRESIFQVASIVTTTGFTTADYNQWPQVLRLFFVFLMFIGGCTGSTGGSIKVIRILIISKGIASELRKMIKPKSVVLHVKIAENTIDRETLFNIYGFIGMFICIFLAASLFMSSLGLDLTTAVTSVAATLGNIGPGLGIVGPIGNYADIPFAGKWTLILCMLLGRLEIYSVVILLLPLTWRNK